MLNVKKHGLFVALTATILFLSFSLDFFGAMSAPAFVGNFKDSEALVSNAVQCKGAYFSGQLLIVADPNAPLVQGSCNLEQLQAYSSQFGLQGRFYTAGYRLGTKVVNLTPDQYVAFAQLVTALASAFIFALLALWVRNKFGLFVANVVTFLIAISPMIVGFSRNLYWALPLLIAPLVYILFLYSPTKPRKTQVFFWLGLSLLLYIRYLCGYEFVTTITIMVIAVIAYLLSAFSLSKKKYMMELTIAGLICVFSFFAALGTHIYSLKEISGSMSQAVEIVKNRAAAHTTGSADYLAYPITGLKSNLNDAYQISNSYLGLEGRATNNSQFWATGVSFINYALLPIIGLPLSLAQPFSTYAQSLILFTCLLLYLYARRSKILSANDSLEVKKLFIGIALGFIGFMSWLILARSHSLVHAHINGILLYLPFALFGYIVVGIYLKTLWQNYGKKRHG